jgi:hypothetical protein
VFKYAQLAVQLDTTSWPLLCQQDEQLCTRAAGRLHVHICARVQPPTGKTSLHGVCTRQHAHVRGSHLRGARMAGT